MPCFDYIEKEGKLLPVSATADNSEQAVNFACRTTKGQMFVVSVDQGIDFKSFKDQLWGKIDEGQKIGRSLDQIKIIMNGKEITEENWFLTELTEQNSLVVIIK